MNILSALGHNNTLVCFFKFKYTLYLTIKHRLCHSVCLLYLWANLKHIITAAQAAKALIGSYLFFVILDKYPPHAAGAAAAAASDGETDVPHGAAEAGGVEGPPAEGAAGIHSAAHRSDPPPYSDSAPPLCCADFDLTACFSRFVPF